MANAPATIDELGLRDCLYLWALLAAQDNRLPIAPTRRMALVVLFDLQARGVLTVCSNECGWETQPGAKLTPIESLRWRFTWTAYETELLASALEDYFDTIDRDDYTIGMELKLWTELAAGEAERFFEQQLVKHGFSAEWAQDMDYAIRESTQTLTIAQWRYCAWAAVRRGASLVLQQNLQLQGLREAIYHEIQNRATLVATHAWDGCSFPPFHPKPTSALAQGFAYKVTNLGPAFWTGWPCAETILGDQHHCQSKRC